MSRRINRLRSYQNLSCGSNVLQAIHLFINIAATMILGCSNTYQQLATALTVGEMRWVLSKRGDSKVGTNSPWAINHKREGKTKAWLAWALLISTSLVSPFNATSIYLLTICSQFTSLPTLSWDLHSTLACQIILLIYRRTQQNFNLHTTQVAGPLFERVSMC